MVTVIYATIAQLSLSLAAQLLSEHQDHDSGSKNSVESGPPNQHSDDP